MKKERLQELAGIELNEALTKQFNEAFVRLSLVNFDPEYADVVGPNLVHVINKIFEHTKTKVKVTVELQK